VSLIVKPDARWDVIDTAADYTRQPGLGGDFATEVEGVWRTIAAQPRLFGRVRYGKAGREIRQALVRRFPYLVVYEVRGSDVIVLAVTHVRARHRTWPGRL
jgi:plasmid stabilization system protein ParE